MAELVVFDSALGLRPAIREWAEQLRRAAHMVHGPDLFDGEVFETYADGAAKRDAVGIPELWCASVSSFVAPLKTAGVLVLTSVRPNGSWLRQTAAITVR